MMIAIEATSVWRRADVCRRADLRCFSGSAFSNDMAQ
jgi:hypothetical protein